MKIQTLARFTKTLDWKRSKANKESKWKLKRTEKTYTSKISSL
jgi:hypothetical protein